VITNVLVRSVTSAGLCHADPNGAVTCVIPGHHGKGSTVVSIGGTPANGINSRQAHGLALLVNSQKAIDVH
jgi:hypothetical protein